MWCPDGGKLPCSLNKLHQGGGDGKQRAAPQGVHDDGHRGPILERGIIGGLVHSVNDDAEKEGVHGTSFWFDDEIVQTAN